ncbi:hypothetical protein Tco_0921262 [Tanacetum coccineum]
MQTALPSYSSEPATARRRYSPEPAVVRRRCSPKLGFLTEKEDRKKEVIWRIRDMGFAISRKQNNMRQPDAEDMRRYDISRRYETSGEKRKETHVWVVVMGCHMGQAKVSGWAMNSCYEQQ